MSSANLPANTGTCRQRSPLSAADVQDAARINLPVHSQTDISVKLIKQSSVAGRRCVTYVNSPLLSVAMYPFSIRFSAPRSVPACPRLPGPARACSQVRAGARGGLRPVRAGAGKVAGEGGKGARPDGNQ